MDYTTEEQTQALLYPDTRTQLQKDLHSMVQANCAPELCGSDENQALERVALQLLHLAQSGSPWIATDIKPPAEMAVLVSSGHSALRAMWVPSKAAKTTAILRASQSMSRMTTQRIGPKAGTSGTTKMNATGN